MIRIKVILYLHSYLFWALKSYHVYRIDMNLLDFSKVLKLLGTAILFLIFTLLMILLSLQELHLLSLLLMYFSSPITLKFIKNNYLKKKLRLLKKKEKKKQLGYLFHISTLNYYFSNG